MDLLTFKRASEISRIPEKTIRDWVSKNFIKKYENERGIDSVDKRELLEYLPTVITLFNQKGGCGKTTASILLADYYERKGDKVLLVDLDQQGNLTQTYFKHSDLQNHPSLYDYFESRTPLQKIVKSYNDFIDVLPSNLKLADKFIGDIDKLDTYKIDFEPLFKKYKIIIVDCPPAIDSFSKLGLILSHYVFIPVIPEPFNYDGLTEVLASIKRMEKYMDNFVDLKVILSYHEQMILGIQESYIDLIKELAKNQVANNTIPNFVGIKERPIRWANFYEFYKNEKKPLTQIENLMKEFDAFIFDERGFE